MTHLTLGELASDDDPGSTSADSAEDDQPVQLHISLNVLDEQPSGLLAGWLDVQLAKIASLAGVHGGELSVAVVDDQQMSDLHEQFMNIAGPTDVLTFDFRSMPGQGPLDGELVLCYDEAARQAVDRGIEVQMELLLYAVHGLLHLLGFDDQDPAAFELMHEEEDRLLTQAGFGAVYAHTKKPEKDEN